MNGLNLVMLVLQIISIVLLWYFKPYITTKGQNQATKEDIDEITRLVKRVETQFQIELGRHSLRNELVSKARQVAVWHLGCKTPTNESNGHPS